MTTTLAGKKVLVIGANGFIGSRVCERLVLEQGAEAIGLVTNLGRSARIGRLGMRIVRGSVLDRDLMTSLTREADYVVALLARSKSAMIQGTRLAASLAREAGVERFIHMSSAAVYGVEPKSAHATEDAPLKKTGNHYSDAKIEAEQQIDAEVAKGLRAVSLRPRIVWGPYSSWITRFYEAAAAGRYTLIDDGVGACNTVYIDNLVDAIFWGMGCEEAIGDVFFVTDGETLTWRDFYGKWAGFMPQPVEFLSVPGDDPRFEQRTPGFFQRTRQFLTGEAVRECLLDAPGLGHLTKSLVGTVAELPESRKIGIKKRLGMTWPEIERTARGQSLPGLDAGRVIRERGTSYTDISKIKALGYVPRIDFETGSEITRTWLQAARYI